MYQGKGFADLFYKAEVVVPRQHGGITGELSYLHTQLPRDARYWHMYLLRDAQYKCSHVL